MEINSTTERPVTRIPDHFQPLADAGYEIILHQQKIADNLKKRQGEIRLAGSKEELEGLL